MAKRIGKRVERDSLGEIEVSANAYYGAQTERAKRNFPVSGQTMPPGLLFAHALIKREAARVNGELGTLDEEIAAAIVEAADDVMAGISSGEWLRHFPVDVFQTGSGTSTNMNLNEVIGNRAIEILGGEIGSKSPVHPNDHVNAGQSSNDTIPTSLHISAYSLMVDRLLPALETLAQSLRTKAHELDDVVKIGRTHLQDAVPVRLGQEFSGYVQQIENGCDRVKACLPRLAELALGGTAAGTGLNAPPAFADRVIAGIAEATGHPFVPAPNKFEALAARDAAVEASGVLKTIAVSLTKVANDVRWLASGPRCGLGEISIPSLQPGSSIMPGKVNPVVPESVLMVAAKVLGNDVTINVGGMNGNFELNVMMPVIAYSLLQSIEITSSASRILAETCVDGIEANAERAREMVEKSLAMVTALVPAIGYDRASTIAKQAYESGRTVREICLEQDILPRDQLEALLDPKSMT